MACSENRLAIFAGLTPEALERADQLHGQNLISVELVDTDGVRIDITARGTADTVQARIRSGHTRIELVRVNDS